MSAEPQAGRAATPVHLWVVGVVALLWNAGGAMDYVMHATHNEEYLAELTSEQLEFHANFPSWIVACWAVAVWGAVLGSLLILLRKALAAPVLALSFLGMLITTVRNFGFAEGREVMLESTGALVFSGVIFVFAVFLVLYSRAMRAQGVLR